MKTAKLFQNGGSQAVRLPKKCRFEGTEVMIEKRGDQVILTPVLGRKYRTFEEIAQDLARKFPDGGEFPEPPRRPVEHQRSSVEF